MTVGNAAGVCLVHLIFIDVQEKLDVQDWQDSCVAVHWQATKTSAGISARLF